MAKIYDIKDGDSFDAGGDPGMSDMFEKANRDDLQYALIITVSSDGLLRVHSSGMSMPTFLGLLELGKSEVLKGV